MMQKVFTDMMGREVSISYPPRRIISTVPSQTELLYDLRLCEEVVGITKFCVHPDEWFRTKTRIGGTKQLHIEKIKELRPDLVIANKEENTQEQIEELARHFPVWISDIHTIPQALQMMQVVGQLTDREQKANELVDEIVARFNQLQRGEGKRVAYFIWYRPWMTVGSDTFIHQVMATMDWQNVFGAYTRYPEVSLQDLKAANPDIVLLSSEPFPFKEKHIEEIRSVLPSAEIRLVDGELFSWYGSRLLHTPAYLQALLQA